MADVFRSALVDSGDGVDDADDEPAKPTRTSARNKLEQLSKRVGAPQPMDRVNPDLAADLFFDDGGDYDHDGDLGSDALGSDALGSGDLGSDTVGSGSPGADALGSDTPGSGSPAAKPVGTSSPKPAPPPERRATRRSVPPPERRPQTGSAPRPDSRPSAPYRPPVEVEPTFGRPAAPMSTAAWAKANPEGTKATSRPTRRSQTAADSSALFEQLAAAEPAEATLQLPATRAPRVAAPGPKAAADVAATATRPPSILGDVDPLGGHSGGHGFIAGRERLVRAGAVAAVGLTAVVAGFLTLTPDGERLEAADPRSAIAGAPESAAPDSEPAAPSADLLRNSGSSTTSTTTSTADGAGGISGQAAASGPSSTTSSPSTSESPDTTEAPTSSTSSSTAAPAAPSTATSSSAPTTASTTVASTTASTTAAPTTTTAAPTTTTTAAPTTTTAAPTTTTTAAPTTTTAAPTTTTEASSTTEASTTGSTGASTTNSGSGLSTTQTSDPDDTGSTTTGPELSPACTSAFIGHDSDAFSGSGLDADRWSVVAVGPASEPTVTVTGGQAQIVADGAAAGGLRMTDSQASGRFVAEVKGAGRLALVAPGSTAPVVSVSTDSDTAWQTLSIEWTPAALVLQRDGVVVQTISGAGSGSLPTSALAVALLTDGTDVDGATLAVDQVTVDRLAPCGTSGSN